MANQYHYGYGAGNGSGREKKPTDWAYWIIALVLLLTFTPGGILMIVLKLAGGGKKKGRHPYYLQQEQRQGSVGARTVQAGAPANSAPRAGTVPPAAVLLNQMASKAKKLTLVGGILSAVFGFAAITEVADCLWILPDLAWFLEETVPLFCFLGAGLGCLWAGLRRQKRVRTFRRCMSMIGQRSSVPISTLSSTMGLAPDKVRDLLEDMLDDGLFPMGYLDYGRDCLMLTSDGVPDPPAREEKEEPAPEKKPEEDTQNAVLEEIRTINAGIDNPKLNQQIDRIGAITARVFEYQRSHPQKSPQLHSFLSYYLPTTLKILRAYAQLEDQEVEGENISAAMERIENMMDKVVEGFEKQLDQLFQGDALDIAADVEVLERMLAKDGLSSQDSLRMGG